VRRHRKDTCRDLESVLRLYRAAALYGVLPAPELVEALQRYAPELSRSLSSRSARLFLDILGCTRHLGAVLRSMFKTGVLECVLPAMAHARGLLQFNQYHSYTVDEHTLRAAEAVGQFDLDDSPLGTAYRSIPRKQMLHLALVLHDLGKGFDEDHSDVGLRIAEDVADRLFLDAQERDVLTFLVHKHLLMAHLAFRRDIADPDVLLPFSREVGTPDTLRMLYVLTAADIQAVGPGVWTDWKAELLSELFGRVMMIVSGKPYRFHEAERLKALKEHVKSSIVPVGPQEEREQLFAWIDRQMDALPAHYWSSTPAARIAQDLQNLQHLQPGELQAEGVYDAETGTVEYRVLAHRDLAGGCFHKLTGALTAKRMEILSAQTSKK
jgi:[protein-PII] uridylyltransferase